MPEMPKAVIDLLDRLEPAEAYRVSRAHDAEAPMYLFVCCGRQMFSGSPTRFCRVCGREIQGDVYRPLPSAEDLDQVAEEQRAKEATE